MCLQYWRSSGRPARHKLLTYAERLRALIAGHSRELAAVIVEPVVPGAGGWARR